MTAELTYLERDAKRALRKRLLPLIVAVSLLGFLLWVPVEKLFMTAIGFDGASIGVMAAAYAALVPIVEIPSGILADRWSRRGVLIIAAGAMTLASLVGGLSYNVATYIGSALVLAVYFAMYSGTMDAIVYDTVLEEIGASDQFEQQIGRVRFVESIALVAGALAGGVIAELATPRLTYFLTVPFAAAAVVALFRFVEPQLHKAEEGTSLRTQLSLTFGAITRRGHLLPIIVLAVLSALLLQSLFEFGPLWLIDLDAAAGLYGPYWAGLMATLGLGGLLAGRVALHKPAVLAVVAVVMVVASLGLAVRGGLVVVIAAQIVLALFLLIASIRASQLLHDSVPSTIRTGVASGVSAIGWMCFVPFAFVLGLLSRSQGVRVAAWMIIGATVLACLALALAARHQPPAAVSAAEALTTRLLRDVRRCLIERRNEVDALDCNQLVELVSEFLDGDLDPHTELRFTHHVSECIGCARYLDQVRQTVERLRELPAADRLPDTTRESLLTTFRESLS
ncbi:MAG: MFS transporter [Nocardioidaceae bacterium]